MARVLISALAFCACSAAALEPLDVAKQFPAALTGSAALSEQLAHVGQMLAEAASSMAATPSSTSGGALRVAFFLDGDCRQPTPIDLSFGTAGAGCRAIAGGERATVSCAADGSVVVTTCVGVSGGGTTANCCNDSCQSIDACCACNDMPLNPQVRVRACERPCCARVLLYRTLCL